jgi:dTDP-4-dehydrorhamnose 3,5-epimerase-like enzyme
MNVIDAPRLGLRFEIRRSDAELVEFDVVGRSRGFIRGAHLHRKQTERFEVIEGS